MEGIDILPSAGEDDNENNVTDDSKHTGDEKKDTLNIELKIFFPIIHNNKWVSENYQKHINFWFLKYLNEYNNVSLIEENVTMMSLGEDNGFACSISKFLLQTCLSNRKGIP